MSDTIVTADPKVNSAETEDGEEIRADYPHDDYARVSFTTTGGRDEQIAVGDALHDDGEFHGTVARIVHQHSGSSLGRWCWTVYFDYADGDYGGAPLGELAKQIDNGARYEGDSPEDDR